VVLDRIYPCTLLRSVNSLSDFVVPTKGETMEVNGIAHVFLTASNFERSGCWGEENATNS